MLSGFLGSVKSDDEILLFISIATALINTVVQLNKMILEAKELEEDILDYLYLQIYIFFICRLMSLICMNGRFRWVPFLKKIKVGVKIEPINFKDILIDLKVAKVKLSLLRS